MIALAFSRSSFCVLLCLTVGMLLAAPQRVLAQEQEQASGEQPEESQIPEELQKALQEAIEQRQQRLASIPWEEGPCVSKLGEWAEIQVPEGYRFTGREGTATLMEMMENPSDPSELGVLMAKEDDYFLVFSFNDIGYVKDDDKAALDANVILASIRAGTEAANAERRNRGWSEMQIIGWLRPPAYDQQTHRLGWAVSASSEGEQVANYDTRVLGRRGVMSVKLVSSPEQINPLVPTVDQLLTGFTFTPGNTYGEWRTGDKVAAYGLTGLITGAAVAVGAKTGLLAKLGVLLAKGGKLIFLAVAGLLAAIAKLFSRVFGGAKKDAA